MDKRISSGVREVTYGFSHTRRVGPPRTAVPEPTMLAMMGHVSTAMLRQWERARPPNLIDGPVAQVDRAPAF